MLRFVLRLFASAALVAAPGCVASPAHSSSSPPDGDTLFVASEGYEAGFVEIEPVHHQYGSPARDLVASRARIFYSLARADVEPEEKPILVVFNGGPGAATSMLLAWNTGARTIDPRYTEGTRTGVNPSRWTRFANVLYVDARGVGFSYDVLDDPSNAGARDEEFDARNYNAFLDAADFVRATMRVLARHPELEGDVVPVGESYGGTRATMMIQLVRHPDRYSAPGATYRDDSLAKEVSALGSKASRLFRRQILLEPLVAGQVQHDKVDEMVSASSDLRALRESGDSGDPYDLRRPGGFTTEVVKRATDAVTDPDTLREVLGVELSSIDSFSPSARRGAARRGGSKYPGNDDFFTATNRKLVARLGELPPWDFYFQPDSFILNLMFAGALESNNGRLFLENLDDVETFVTNAKYDGVCLGEALAPTLAGYSDLVDSVTVDAAAELLIVKLKSPDGGVRERRIRFPTYANSGHVVSLSEPEKLAADMEAWLAGR